MTLPLLVVTTSDNFGTSAEVLDTTLNGSHALLGGWSSDVCPIFVSATACAGHAFCWFGLPTSMCCHLVWERAKTFGYYCGLPLIMSWQMVSDHYSLPNSGTAGGHHCLFIIVFLKSGIEGQTSHNMANHDFSWADGISAVAFYIERGRWPFSFMQCLFEGLHKSLSKWVAQCTNPIAFRMRELWSIICNQLVW